MKIIFLLILLYSAIIDIKTKKVIPHSYIFIFIIGLNNFNIYSIIGGVISFGFMIIFSIFTNIGGGDVKLIGACGFYLQAPNNVLMLIIVFILLLINLLIIKLFKRNVKVIPFVPHIFLANLITILC